MDSVVTSCQGSSKRREREQDVEGDLRKRGSNPDVVDKGRPKRSEHPEARYRHLLTKRVRHEIHVVAERGQRADAVELAERCPAGLEERLRRDHQNAHRWVIFS